jgi:hypothetical protein
MPWDIILATLGTSGVTVVIMTVLGLTLAQKLIEQGVASAARRLESPLNRAEEAYKNAVELNSQIDIHLREQRIKVYSDVWQMTGLFPRWPRATDVTYADALRFSQALRTWYFEQGGMWLSTAARSAYGDLQETNTRVLAEKLEGELKPPDYDAILDKCHTLRTELTNDLLSRRAAPTEAA